MSELIFIRDLILVLLTAFVFGACAKKLYLPLLVGYLLGGMILGTFFNRFFSAFEMRSVAEIGVALLLFTLGLEFSLAKLKELGDVIIFGSLIQVLLTTILGIFIFPLFGIDFYSSLFLGAVFSLSSTAAVLKTLSDKGELETLHGEMSAGWLFMQDLYTLPLIIILPAVGVLMKGENLGVWGAINFSKSLFFAFISFFIIIYLGKQIIPFIFEKIADLGSRELVLVAAVTFCLLFAYLFRILGFSSAFGAFVAGIILSSSSSHHGIFAEIRPLRDLFSIVFFVSLGFIISPLFIINYWPMILTIAIIVVFLKFFISAALVLILGYHTKTAILVGISLTSVGEFAFILALLGINFQLIDQQIFMIILSVSFLTLVFCIPLLSLSDKIYYQMKKFIEKNIPVGARFFRHFDRMPQQSTDLLSDHVVVLGHGRVGKYICRALSKSDIPFVVIDYNHHLVKSLQKQGIRVIYGDPAEIDVLNFAQVIHAKVAILAYADRHTQETVIANILTINPNIKLICRVHFEEDQKKLKGLGVESLIQPEFEAALSMADRLLRMFNVKRDVIEIKLKDLRKEHGLE